MDIDRAIAKAHLNSAGWELNSHRSQNPIEAQATFYIVDMANQEIILATVSREAFDAMPVSDEAESFAGMIRDLVGRSEEELAPEAAGPLIGYIKATQTYQAWARQYGPDERMHIILMLYSGAVRPVMARWQSTVIDHESLSEIAAQALLQDREAHPEWFE